MADVLFYLEHLLGNRYWRIGLIVGLAIVVALLLRIFFLPLLNRLTRKTASHVDDHILALVNPAILRTAVLEGLHWAAVDFAGDENIIFVIHGLVITLLALLWGRVILGSGAVLLGRFSNQDDRWTWIQPQTLPLVTFSFKVILFGTQAYIIMSAWRIDLTHWLASAGVMGIAVGFAAKDTLANFISGIFILVDSPYQVGQYINIDNETRGVVTDIGMRSTRLLTTDNVEVTVPNSIIGNSKVVNESSGPSTRMRVRVTASVPYGSDVEQVKELLASCTAEIPFAAKDSASTVRFTSMGDSALIFTVMTWVDHPEYRGTVIDTLNTRVYQALQEAGIEIPFPQQDIHIKNWEQKPST